MIKIKAVFLMVCISASCVHCAGNKDLIQKRARAKQSLGLSYIQQGDTKGGIRHLMEAAKLDPEDANMQHELALAYRNLKLYEEALGHFNRAVALKPDFSEAWNNMGTLYLVTEKWDLAIGCFEKAVTNITYETPQFAYNNLGLAYYKKGEHQKAVDSYKQALELSPSYSICHTNLGLAYEAVERWEEAIDAYDKAVSYYPENSAAHLNLGKLYLRLGRSDKAATELNLALEVDPSGPNAAEVRELLQKHL